MELAQYEGHGLSHAGDSNESQQAQWEQMLVWYSEQLAYLLQRLASVPEGEGTMLDNTIVLCVNEISRGNTHSHDNMHFLLAGGAMVDCEAVVTYGTTVCLTMTSWCPCSMALALKPIPSVTLGFAMDD